MEQLLNPDTMILIGAMVTIIVGVCEGLKSAGVPSRFIPLISVLFGLGFAYFSSGVDFVSTASGVILGLATTGGYRVVKTSILNK